MSKLDNGIIEDAHIEDVTEVEEVVERVDADEEPTVEEVVEEEPKPTNNVINLDMSDATRTNVWVNGDSTKVLKLNLTDMGIISRFSDAYPKLLALQDEISAMMEENKPEEMNGIDELSAFASQFKVIDKKMRDYVDSIFDFGVSDVCSDGGSMYDLVAGGWWRFEYIIDKIGKLYNQKFGEEMKKNDKRMQMHTNKYTGNPERGKGKGKYTKKYARK